MKLWKKNQERGFCHENTIPVIQTRLYFEFNLMMIILSRNKPVFQCNIAITNFLVSHTCETRFHNAIGQTLYICIPTQ